MIETTGVRLGALAASTMLMVLDAQAVDVDLLYSLVEPTPVNDRNFGADVAVTEDFLLVSTYNDSAGFDGVVYLFDTADGSLITQFESPDAIEGDQTSNGFRKATMNEQFIVLGPETAFGSVPGRVHVYSAADFEPIVQIEDPLQRTAAQFGRAIALEGDRVLVGSEGYAHLFELPSGDLIETFAGPDAGFGSSVALSEERVLVGDPGGGNIFGEVSLYDVQSGTRLQTFNTPTPQAGGGNEFGKAVALLGDSVVVGGNGPDATGAAHLFDGASGELVATLLDPAPETLGGFGIDVALSDQNVIVGSNKSAAYVYRRDTGEFVQTVAVPVGNASAVDTGGARLAIGSPGANGAEPGANRDTGAVHLYTFGERLFCDFDGSGGYDGVDLAIYAGRCRSQPDPTPLCDLNGDGAYTRQDAFIYNRVCSL
jgi:hypothetical protein